MLLSPVFNKKNKKAWENFTIFADDYFYSFFGTGITNDNDTNTAADGLDIYRSNDGINFEQVAEYTNPIKGAHAGFCVKKIGNWFYYYPTCSDERGVHFKIYRTHNFTEWEYLGAKHDVLPDQNYYRERWDEMVTLDDFDEDGKLIIYGYISSEPHEELFAPGPGMLSSYDGINWTVLPPAKVEWGEIPAQHMEVNFVEKLGNKYYLSMSGRLYMDSYGYSLYTFVGDSPTGPFYPDVEKFRLTGNTRRDITWLGHTIHTPYGLLLAQWLSHDVLPDIPSHTFAIATLKRLICPNGHLRLAYWEQNDQLFDMTSPITTGFKVEFPPLGKVTSRDKVTVVADGHFKVSASRDGVLLLSNKIYDKSVGIIMRGSFICHENRGIIATHQHASALGFYFEDEPGEGIMMCADTLGVTRSGRFRYSDTVISHDDIYANAGYGLVSSRSGKLSGYTHFDFDDSVGPYGHASYAGIRHGIRHIFTLITRMDYFELYIDKLYVQTYLLPDNPSGRLGICIFDGTCDIELNIYPLHLPSEADS